MKLMEIVYSSIKEKPVKSFLILLVVCLLGTFMSASFSIYQATKRLEYRINSGIAPIVLIDWGAFVSKETRKEKTVDVLKEDDRVLFIENRYGIYNYYFDLYIVNENDESVYYDGKTNLILGIDSTVLSDYLDNQVLLSEGSFIQNDNSKKEIFYIKAENKGFAYKGLKVGDNLTLQFKPKFYTLTVGNNDPIMGNYPFPEFELNNIQVVGIGEYLFNAQGRKNHTLSTQHTYEELQYVSKNTLLELSKIMTKIYSDVTKQYPEFFEAENIGNLGKIYLNQTYIQLKSINDLKGFINDVYSLDLGDIVEIYSFSDAYNDVGSILYRMSLISIITLVVACVSAVILLSLVIHVFVYERRHEIGIFISLGESKKNIIKQVLLEVLIVGMIGISLSVFSGNIIGSQLSEGLLNKQMEQYTQVQNMSDDAYEIKENEIKEAFDTSITMEYIISVYVGGFVVLAISCIYPTRSILKMKARKMLM